MASFIIEKLAPGIVLDEVTLAGAEPVTALSPDGLRYYVGGGFGYLWRAGTHGEYAIKRFYGDDMGVARREFELLSRLNGHGFTPTVFCVGTLIDDSGVGSPAIVESYISGVTLQRAIEDGLLSGSVGRGADTKSASLVALAVAEALRGLAEAGVAHRDLSAANIMLSKRCLEVGLAGGAEVVLVDFGQSTSAARGNVTPAWRLRLATIPFGAPEVFGGRYNTEMGYGAKCDTWSLGAIVVAMMAAGEYWPERIADLRGARELGPTDLERIAEAKRDPLDLVAIAGLIKPSGEELALADIVRSCTEYNPHLRPSLGGIIATLCGYVGLATQEITPVFARPKAGHEVSYDFPVRLEKPSPELGSEGQHVGSSDDGSSDAVLPAAETEGVAEDGDALFEGEGEFVRQLVAARSARSSDGASARKDQFGVRTEGEANNTLPDKDPQKRPAVSVSEGPRHSVARRSGSTAHAVGNDDGVFGVRQAKRRRVGFFAIAATIVVTMIVGVPFVSRRLGMEDSKTASAVSDEGYIPADVHNGERVDVADNLAGYSWVELKSIADEIAAADSDEAGLEVAKSYGLVDSDGRLQGDTKALTLTDGTECAVRVAGFRHDDKSDGSGKAGITFEFADVPTTHNMNSSQTNEGGWKVSFMRSWLNDDFYGILPDDLKSGIVEVTKRTNNVGEVDVEGDTSVVNDTKDKLWLLSLFEVYGSFSDYTYNDKSYNILYSADTYDADGTQYKLYADQGVSISNNYLFSAKKGAHSWWWLRSPVAGLSHGFHYVYSDGGWLGGFADHELGVSPGFCF